MPSMISPTADHRIIDLGTVPLFPEPWQSPYALHGMLTRDGYTETNYTWVSAEPFGPLTYFVTLTHPTLPTVTVTYTR